MRYIPEQFDIETGQRDSVRRPRHSDAVRYLVADTLAEHREEWKKEGSSGKAEGLRESYLEIEEGKSFRIKLRCIRPAEPHPDFQLQVLIDGRKITSSAWKASKTDSSVVYMYVFENGVTKMADLTFASLPKTDEDALAAVRGQAIDRLCKIDVLIRQGTYTLSTKQQKPRTVTDASVGLVHEKQLKLGSTVQAANVRDVKERRSYDFSPTRRDPNVCRFIWNYHTRTQLNLMGIVEDAPATIALPLTIQRLSPHPTSASAKRTSSSVKREASSLEDARGGKRVKAELVPTGNQNQPIVLSAVKSEKQGLGRSGVKAEVIDLTDD